MSLQNAVQPLWPFVITTALITLNEMGDKSQFLAMAFATRFKVRKVIVGIFLAVALMGALGVAVGSLLASVPGWQGVVSLISALLFLVFGVWSLKADSNSEVFNNNKKSPNHRRYGDVVAVFVAFLFAEMGDKTQLVTITLAAQYPSAPLMVLAGTTAGMLIADGLGIFAGIALNRRLPDRVLKLISSALFFFFGLSGVWNSLRESFRMPPETAAAIVVLAAMLTLAASFVMYRIAAANG